MLPAATQQPQAQIQATGGVQRLSPAAQQLLDAVRAAQSSTPVYMPFAAGTPTQRRREADESTRQFGIAQDMREREFAADEAYRAAQVDLDNRKLALGAQGGSSGSSGGNTPTTINQRATQQVWSYNTPEEAVTAYGYYGPDMAAAGVDLSKVWNELKKRWPDYKAFQKEKDSNDSADQIREMLLGGGGG